MKYVFSKCLLAFTALASTGVHLTTAHASNSAEEYAFGFSDTPSAASISLSDLNIEKPVVKAGLENRKAGNLGDPVRYGATKKNDSTEYYIDIYPNIENRKYKKSGENGKWVCSISFPASSAKLRESNENYPRNLTVLELEKLKKYYESDFRIPYPFKSIVHQKEGLVFYRINTVDHFANSSILKYSIKNYLPEYLKPKETTSDLDDFLEVKINESAKPFNQYKSFECFHDTYFPEKNLGKGFICTPADSCSIDDSGIAFHVDNEKKLTLSLPMKFSMQIHSLQPNISPVDVIFFLKTPYIFTVAQGVKNLSGGVYYRRKQDDTWMYVQKENTRLTELKDLTDLTGINLDAIFMTIPDMNPASETKFSLNDILEGKKKDTLNRIALYRNISRNNFRGFENIVFASKGKPLEDYERDNLVRFLFRYQSDENAIKNLNGFLKKNRQKLSLPYKGSKCTNNTNSWEPCSWQPENDKEFIKILPKLSNLKTLVVDKNFGTFKERFTKDEFEKLAKNLDVLDLGDHPIYPSDVNFLKNKISSLKEIKFTRVDADSLALCCHAEASGVKNPFSGNEDKFKEITIKDKSEAIEGIERLLLKYGHNSTQWKFAIHHICKQKEAFSDLRKVISDTQSENAYGPKKFFDGDLQTQTNLNGFAAAGGGGLGAVGGAKLGAVVGGVVGGPVGGIIGGVAGMWIFANAGMLLLNYGVKMMEDSETFCLNHSLAVDASICDYLRKNRKYWFMNN